MLLFTGTSEPARAAGDTAKADDAAEAWYSTAPISTCPTPLGCPPSTVPSSPYPANTLHVGVAGGQETARTYVVPDLSALPVDADVTTGRMTLPVASGTSDGSLRPETAVIKACLVTQPVQDGTAGATQTPPAIDDKVCTPATYSTADIAFTLDLTPFISRWNVGTPNDGVALVPNLSKAGPTTTWHATFNGKKRTTGLHISSLFSYTISPVVLSPPLNPVAAPPIPVAPPPAATPPLSAGAQQSLSTPPPPPAVAGPARQQPVAASGPLRFQYPAAFLLPLAFLAAAVFLFRLFTGDPTPIGVRA